MKKRLLAVLATLVALMMCISLFACTDNNTEDDTNDKINVVETDENGNVIESGDEIGPGNQNTEIGDPNEYDYIERDEAVYVNNPGSAVTLRSEDYEAKGSVKDGTELRRIGLSNDEANYWSKVLYNGETYYVASKFLTTIKDPDEGFVEVDKIVVVNDETGSLNIRNLPTTEGSQIIGWAVAGAETKVVAENSEIGWYKVEFTPYGSDKVAYGYISSDKDFFVVTEDDADENATTGSTAESNDEAEGGSGK